MKHLFIIISIFCFALISKAQTFSGTSNKGYNFYLRIHPDSTVLLVYYNENEYTEDTGTIERFNDTFKLTAITRYWQSLCRCMLNWSHPDSIGKHPSRFETESIIVEEDMPAYCDSFEIEYLNGKKIKFYFPDKKTLSYITDRNLYNRNFKYYANTFHKNPFTKRFFIQKNYNGGCLSLSSGRSDNNLGVIIKNNQVIPVTHLLAQYGYFVLKKLQ